MLMLNPELLRRDPDRTRAALARRGEDAVEAFNAAIAADDAWRRLTAEVEQLRAERRQRAAARRGRPSEDDIREERRLGEHLAELERQLKELEEERHKALAWVPNLPDESVPLGTDETDNEILREWGERRTFDFEPLPHWDLAEKLGILDLQAGALVAGAGGFFLKGAGGPPPPGAVK